MMNARILTKICLGLFVLQLYSCDIINPAEEVPAYINVQSVDIQTNPITEGTSNQKITEVWVTVDGIFLGAYTLPSTFPLIVEPGEHEIAFQAGIKDNGITSSPDIYPFFSVYETTVNLEPEQTVEIRPSFNYTAITSFAFVENFEGGSQVFRDISLGREDQFALVEEGAFENGRSAKITLDNDNITFQAATIERYNNLVSINSTDVYLEVNYKSDIPVVFGVIGHTAGSTAEGQPLFSSGFLPSANWNKIYFNLSLIISQLRLDEYQVVFQAAIPLDEENQPSMETAEVWLDNIKLVHFNI
jgi:hypothetical protein